MIAVAGEQVFYPAGEISDLTCMKTIGYVVS